MNALLSIKPRYVDEIIAGRKRYEFRKTVFKRDVDEVWIYSSSPEKRLVGTFVVAEVIEDTPVNLWKKLSAKAGIKKDDFFDYYDGTHVGYAIKIGAFRLFSTPVDPEEVFPGFVPPQSFWYFNSVSSDEIDSEYLWR